jgi:hypothetical protein
MVQLQRYSFLGSPATRTSRRPAFEELATDLPRLAMSRCGLATARRILATNLCWLKRFAAGLRRPGTSAQRLVLIRNDPTPVCNGPSQMKDGPSLTCNAIPRLAAARRRLVTGHASSRPSVTSPQRDLAGLSSSFAGLQRPVARSSRPVATLQCILAVVRGDSERRNSSAEIR